MVVPEGDDGKGSIVSLVNPREMFKVVSNAELEAIAGEVDGKLQRVLEAL